MMNSRERLLSGLIGVIPDRLPVTTHHLMDYFRNTYMNGISNLEIFDHFNLDAIHWTAPVRPDFSAGDYYDPTDPPSSNPLHSRRIVNDNWQITTEEIPNKEYATTRYTITTPKGKLTSVLQSNQYTTWVSEHLIKEKMDIDLIAEYATAPLCDFEQVNNEAKEFGERGIIRGHIPGFDIYGQPGCWQDAAVLVGIEKLILETFDDPFWVHELLEILCIRKEIFIRSLKSARYDLLELGGGDASSSVISPKIFRTFVTPYDARLINLAHENGQRIVYHTCGGMMPILEEIANMHPDAMETFTPREMGGDINLVEAKKRIGERVCMIGGFDQSRYFWGCSEAETRQAVRACFETAGIGGGFILCPSDHFFDADPKLLAAFASEAHLCTYQ
jgi:hypothetical protein